MDQIPCEILSGILENLAYPSADYCIQSLVAASLVNRRWHAVVDRFLYRAVKIDIFELGASQEVEKYLSDSAGFVQPETQAKVQENGVLEALQR